MAQRVKLGLVFKYDESWVAGSYYVLNLVHALKTLALNQQPEIILFTDRIEDQKMVESIGYPWVTHKKYIPEFNTFEKLINKFSRILFKKNLVEKRMKNSDLDYIFIQRRSWETDLISNTKKIFWIPDCQELLMPELFFKRELEGRRHVYNEMILSKSKILFSSHAALSDFKSFYPQASNQMYVVNFAVTHPDFMQVNIKSLEQKYQIETSYFMVPNQFWVHKNHRIVLKAALVLKNKNIPFKIIFTGKENDFRAPEYTKELKQFVIENELSNHISFLGFIPRDEQLCLMSNSLAIIQPSLFEGWSTVVEDAKALNKLILLSDIDVHLEQIKENVFFFNPKEANELAELMTKTIQHNFNIKVIDYHKNIARFGQDFYNMIKEKD